MSSIIFLFFLKNYVCNNIVSRR